MKDKIKQLIDNDKIDLLIIYIMEQTALNDIDLVDIIIESLAYKTKFGSTIDIGNHRFAKWSKYWLMWKNVPGSHHTNISDDLLEMRELLADHINNNFKVFGTYD